MGNAVPLVLGTTLVLFASTVGRSEDVYLDVTGRSGIQVTHVNGAKGQRLLPETMIGGAGWIDYDGDGRLDLYIVQGHDNPRAPNRPGSHANVLYRNRGDGSFEDVTKKAGVGDRRYGAGLAVGDYDNDGDQDLYVTNVGDNVLYRNNGDGTFTDVTEESGLKCPIWSASAAFFDFDADGLLDLYVANYVYYDAATQKACRGAGGIPSYCHPNKFIGAPDSLYRNLGNGKFEDVTKSSGVGVSGKILSKGLGILTTDFDLDGDIDILVANDSVPNFLWRNLGDGKFEDAALEAGVSLNVNGDSEACMGVDGADINGDGWMDYFMTNFSRETDTLYMSDEDGFFLDGTHRRGLGKSTYLPLGFGTRFVDFDLDG
ncbi:MAG: VCBS repeat-containing protein, partial [Planctomycetota bacterium]